MGDFCEAWADNCESLADYNDFDLANKKHNSPIDNKFLEEFEFPSLTKNIDKKTKDNLNHKIAKANFDFLKSNTDKETEMISLLEKILVKKEKKDSGLGNEEIILLDEAEMCPLSLAAVRQPSFISDISDCKCKFFFVLHINKGQGHE